MISNQASDYVQMSASANVSARPAALTGIFCSSSTSGTATVHDSAATGTGKTIVAVFNLTAGTWYPLPFIASEGLYVVIGGTAAITVGLQPAR